MSGPGGHQFPGGFPGAQPSMRNNFAGPMGTPMAPQMGGMMNGQMGSGGMVGMGNPMAQTYGNNMQSAMGGMGVMPNQGMSIGGAAASPSHQGVGGGVMGMPPSGMGGGGPGSVGMVGGGGSPMVGSGMGSPMVGIASPLSNSSMANAGGIGQGSAGGAGAPVNQSPTAIGQQQANQTTATNAAAASQQQQQPQQNKEFNTASLCRFGQETVQDIVSRTQEVFQTLKAIQPPNGTTQGVNSSNEKKAKIQEQLRTIRLLFKRLRLIYEKCNENCQVPGMEYTHIESLIPLKEEYETKSIDEKKTSETDKQVCEENRELTEQVVLKNKQLKDVINNLRTIIWEINVMLSMRRS